MPWICPNECHKSAPGWYVIRRETGEIYFKFAAEDKSLSTGKLQAGVHAGTVREEPVCSTCNTCVTWEEPPPVVPKVNAYQVTWQGVKGEIFTTDPLSVCFAGGDVTAEYIMVLASFRAQFRNPSKVARIVKVEIYEKDPT